MVLHPALTRKCLFLRTPEIYRLLQSGTQLQGFIETAIIQLGYRVWEQLYQKPTESRAVSATTVLPIPYYAC
eukprot:1162143-Pelagomonas_calceolata.AAC.17